MFQFFGSRLEALQDGTSRRDFLKVGALGLSGLMLTDLLRARAGAAAAVKSAKNTSVVWLWLGGGATHIETFDPKMTAPAEYRSVFGAVKTNVPGIEIGASFPKMARRADKMAFVRSFAHQNSEHGGGSHWVMTGYDFPQAGANSNLPNVRPAFGSILARHRGATDPATGLPTYVRLGLFPSDGPAWLGPAYSPFEMRGQALNNMNPKVGLDRLNDRRTLLKTFDTLDRQVDQRGFMDGLDSIEQQAFSLVVGKARQAFDIEKEDPRIRDMYGPGLGQRMLLARRLCEAGVGFVTVNHPGWDNHDGIVKPMNLLAPQMDRAVSAFLDDLSHRGFEKNILLVITSEFGRTPRINSRGGRDHWAPLSTLALAGGGLKMGQVVGESSPKSEVPKSTPITPQDLMATLFHALGLPQDLQYKDPSGRPVYIIEGGKPIRELV